MFGSGGSLGRLGCAYEGREREVPARRERAAVPMGRDRTVRKKGEWVPPVGVEGGLTYADMWAHDAMSQNRPRKPPTTVLQVVFKTFCQFEGAGYPVW